MRSQSSDLSIGSNFRRIEKYLDSENGYWRFSGYGQWEPAAITDALGESWHFVTGTNYKLYPCGGVLRTCLDCLVNIINENSIKPEDIEKVIVYAEPLCVGPVFQNKEIKSSIDAQFSAGYVFSVAAHGIKPGPQWQHPDTMRNASILGLMKKVALRPHPEYTRVLKEDPVARLGKVEVVARGKTLSEERRYFKGASSPVEFRLTDEGLAEKFRHQASRILPADKVDRAVDSILHLEAQEDISDVMANITL
ncbi:hypothetical protein ACFLV0_02955 [Chloroflexota bacterium]